MLTFSFTKDQIFFLYNRLVWQRTRDSNQRAQMAVATHTLTKSTPHLKGQHMSWTLKAICRHVPALCDMIVSSRLRSRLHTASATENGLSGFVSILKKQQFIETRKLWSWSHALCIDPSATAFNWTQLNRPECEEFNVHKYECVLREPEERFGLKRFFEDALSAPNLISLSLFVTHTRHSASNSSFVYSV